MQIKPSTAAGHPINVAGVQTIDRNNEAGAKYMRYMVTQYSAKEAMDQVTKVLFAIASYNAGRPKSKSCAQKPRSAPTIRIYGQ
jgi:membrane-bound lytic murein transglycosylase MltF